MREGSSDVWIDRLPAPSVEPLTPIVTDPKMDDPFGNMREQMERERENFFKTNPRDWGSDSSVRGGMFSRVSISRIAKIL